MNVVVTTNTISEWFVEPEHAALIQMISSLASQGLTMKAIAENLNEQGLRSHTGKAFYPELVGALISKYRKKATSRYVNKSVTLTNKDGGYLDQGRPQSSQEIIYNVRTTVTSLVFGDCVNRGEA